MNYKTLGNFLTINNKVNVQYKNKTFTKTTTQNLKHFKNSLFFIKRDITSLIHLHYMLRINN